MKSNEVKSFTCPNCERIILDSAEHGEHVIIQDSPFALGSGGEYIMNHWEVCGHAYEKHRKRLTPFGFKRLIKRLWQRAFGVHYDDSVYGLQEVRDDHPQ